MSDGRAGPSRDPSRFRLRTGRMEAFSDGVFAIATTLLVLDLVVPVVTSPDISRTLVDQWPIYLAYLVSFATIGAAWISHTAITEYLERADLLLLRLNLLLLISVMTSVVWRYAVSAHLVKGETGDDELRAITRKLTPTFGLYLEAIAIGLRWPRAAVVMYMLIALFLLFPVRSIVRHLRERGRG